MFFVALAIAAARPHPAVLAQGQPARPAEVPDDPPAAIAARQLASARSPRIRAVVGPYVSVQVNVDQLGRNIVGDAANEPSIAVNPLDPNNIVIGWRQFDSVVSNFRQAGWAYSRNRGQTWTFPGVLTPGTFRSDPVLDSDSSGNFYFQSLQQSFNMDVFKSVDGGATWGPPVPAFGGDKNWLAIDKTGSIGNGNVYGIWQRFSACCGDNTFSRSTNGAQAFEFPVVVPFRPLFGTLAIGPVGELYATGVDGTLSQNFNQFVIAKSTNARNAAVTPTFGGSQVNLGGSMVLNGGPNPGGLLGQANVAVDASSASTRGNVYIVASVNPPDADPLDVNFIKSSDGGVTWSAPVRINNDTQAANHWQWFGAHSVAPNGRIDVIWNDTRASGQSNISELFYAYSYDAGATWRGHVAVSPPFNSLLGFPNQNKIGDYYTLVSGTTGADVAYAATFNQEQDVYYLRVFPDCNGNSVSDVIDIEVGTSLDINTNHVPDECELVLTRPFPGIAGQLNILFTLGGTPQHLVLLVRGQVGGTTPLSFCPGALNISDPLLAGIGQTTASGIAGVLTDVPPALAHTNVLYQAVEYPSCALSDVITFSFP